IASSSGNAMRPIPRPLWWQRPCAAYEAPVMWCSFHLDLSNEYHDISRMFGCQEPGARGVARPARFAPDPRYARVRCDSPMSRDAEEDRVDVRHRRALQVPAVFQGQGGDE